MQKAKVNSAFCTLHPAFCILVGAYLRRVPGSGRQQQASIASRR
jgi:hypothetical protein